MNPLIGREFGPYRIEAEVGVGGMATVYRAFHATMNRHVAIKILPEHMSRDENFRRRFEREAMVIAKLEHANILPVYDYGEVDNRLYLVMRYISSGSLRDLMAAGPLELAEVNRILNQVGGALAYAHRLDIIHRDIKPANVLLDEQKACYLTDFGLAKLMTASDSMQLTATGVGMGTPAYMSPEQGQGEPADFRSDIYSLGIMLYEMVTGRVPFEAETPIGIVFKHISDPLPLPSSIEPNLPSMVEQVIIKALAKNPADRFASAEAMTTAFQGALAGADTATFALRDVPPPDSEIFDTIRAKPKADSIPAAALPFQPQPEPVVNSPKQPVPWWIFALGAVIAVLLGVLVWAVISTFSPAAEVAGITPTGAATAAAVDLDATATVESQATLMAQEKLDAAATTTVERGSTATVAANQTSAAQAKNQATTEAIDTAVAQLEATAGAMAIAASAIDATATARIGAADSATATANAAALATSTATPNPPTATPTPPPTATFTPAPTDAPRIVVPSLSGKLAFPLVQGNYFKVYVVEVSAAPPTELYAGIGDARHPSLSYDGQYLLVDSTGGDFGGITRYTSRGHQATEVTCRAKTSESGRPAWSPDGAYLAFDGLAADPANPQIYIHKITEPTCDLVNYRFMVQGGPVIENSGLYPLWGADNRLYFRSCATWIGEGGNCGIWSANPDGSDVKKLHDNPNHFPTSIRGNRLLTMSAQDGNWEVYSVNTATGQITDLSNSAASADLWGTISPDGRTIAFLSNRGGPWAIWMMNADGSNPRAWLNINIDWGEIDPDRMMMDRMSWSK